jgi:hypothetical protein
MSNTELLIGSLDLPPRYDPWLGIEYQKRLRAHIELRSLNNILSRVHIMGESHKGVISDDKSDVTQRTIADHAFQREAGGAFFTKVMQVLQGVEAHEVNRQGWHGIAYSNFLQSWMENDRKEPTNAQFDDARQHFFGQLLVTRPTVLFVLGKRCWQETPKGAVRMPVLEGRAGTSSFDDAWMYVYESERGLEYTLAVHSNHPSGGGFNRRLAHEHLDRCLAYYSNLVEYTQEKYDLVGRKT